jgi:hypothetical protein
MPLLPYLGIQPVVGDGLELDDQGFVIGKVTLGRDVRIGARTVLRGDQDSITIGDAVWFGQAVSVHMDPTFPTQVGNEVVVEDDAIVHGCVRAGWRAGPGRKGVSGPLGNRWDTWQSGAGDDGRGNSRDPPACARAAVRVL